MFTGLPTCHPVLSSRHDSPLRLSAPNFCQTPAPSPPNRCTFTCGASYSTSTGSSERVTDGSSRPWSISEDASHTEKRMRRKSPWSCSPKDPPGNPQHMKDEPGVVCCTVTVDANAIPGELPSGAAARHRSSGGTSNQSYQRWQVCAASKSDCARAGSDRTGSLFVRHVAFRLSWKRTVAYATRFPAAVQSRFFSISLLGGAAP